MFGSDAGASIFSADADGLQSEESSDGPPAAGADCCELAAVWESAPPGGYTAALRDAVRRIVAVDGGAQLDSAHSADSARRSSFGG